MEESCADLMKQCGLRAEARVKEEYDSIGSIHLPDFSVFLAVELDPRTVHVLLLSCTYSTLAHNLCIYHLT